MSAHKGGTRVRTAAHALVVSLGLLTAYHCDAQTGATTLASTSGIATLNPVGEQQTGVWLTSYLPGQPLFFDVDAVAFRPWAKGLFDTRQQHDLEPHARCKASGAIRQFLTPYGVEIVEIKELERLYIFDIGGPHTYRP
jgi:hypothetical protein